MVCELCLNKAATVTKSELGFKTLGHINVSKHASSWPTSHTAKLLRQEPHFRPQGHLHVKAPPQVAFPCHWKSVRWSWNAGKRDTEVKKQPASGSCGLGFSGVWNSEEHQSLSFTFPNTFSMRERWPVTSRAATLLPNVRTQIPGLMSLFRDNSILSLKEEYKRLNVFW